MINIYQMDRQAEKVTVKELLQKLLTGRPAFEKLRPIGGRTQETPPHQFGAKLMKVKLITGTGAVDVDLSKLPLLMAAWSSVEIERAKPLESVDAPVETNEGGAFNFRLIPPLEFFKKTRG